MGGYHPNIDLTAKQVNNGVLYLYNVHLPSILYIKSLIAQAGKIQSILKHGLCGLRKSHSNKDTSLCTSHGKKNPKSDNTSQ